MSFLSGVMQTLSGGAPEFHSNQLLFDKVVGIRGIVEGVGATTVAYNLAAALSDNTNYRICVLDTHILYPTLRGLLVTQALPNKDWFDFTQNVSEIVCDTKFRNVSYIGFYNRDISDVLSAKECRAALDNLLTVLKDIFDIIIVDLSSEYTNIAVNSAIQCNKIYTIVSPEPSCMFGFKSSINTAVSLAVPPYKLRNVIFNKSVGRLDTTMLNLLKENNFEVIATIPYSTELVRYNLLGNAFWGATTRNPDITAANNAMMAVFNDTVEKTTLNEQYVLPDGEHNNTVSQESDESGINRALNLQEQTIDQSVVEEKVSVEQKPVHNIVQQSVRDMGTQQKGVGNQGNLVKQPPIRKSVGVGGAKAVGTGTSGNTASVQQRTVTSQATAPRTVNRGLNRNVGVSNNRVNKQGGQQ